MSPEALEFYGSMSPYELMELINSAISATMEILAIYISILSAYLLVAYYFGDKLNSIELLLFSSMYTLFCSIMCFGAYATASQAVRTSVFAGGPNGNYSLSIFGLIFVMIVSWMLSLLFMIKRWRLK